MKINNRIELPKLLTESSPIGVELGVATGTFSKKLIDRYNWKRFYMIDWYRFRTEPPERYEQEKLRQITRYLNLIEYHRKITKTEAILLRGTFNEFVSFFSDGFFDFIYIDGLAHTGQLEGQTIRDWLPKIKPNGVICGHDYCDEYPKTKHYVDLVAHENKLKVNVIGLEENYASWYYTKI